MYLFFSQIERRTLGCNQAILVCIDLQEYNGAPCPSSNGVLVMLDLLEFSNFQLAEAMAEACHREPLFIIFDGISCLVMTPDLFQ